MNISRDKIERLTFVKYLLSQADTQKNLERPLCSSAILTIHDCIECFLQLCFEVKTGKAKISSQKILETYTDEINKVLLEESKPQINKAFIKRINELRNQLKHSTIFIDQKLIPELYTESKLFLTDFTELIFKMPFEKISLIELITDEPIRIILRDAENDINNIEYYEAMRKIGIAFYELKAKLTKVNGSYNQNVFGSNFQIDYMIKYGAQFGGSEPDNVLRENLVEIANDINKLQDDIIDLKTIMSLSVNIKEYMIFREKTPDVRGLARAENEKPEYWTVEDNYNVKPSYSLEEVKNSLNFVIELALKV
jgi:uncharacterized protein YutE (UPF0331/DUF86 family)